MKLENENLGMLRIIAIADVKDFNGCVTGISTSRLADLGKLAEVLSNLGIDYVYLGVENNGHICVFFNESKRTALVIARYDPHGGEQR